jgi:hypothetical protein
MKYLVFYWYDDGLGIPQEDYRGFDNLESAKAFYKSRKQDELPPKLYCLVENELTR